MSKLIPYPFTLPKFLWECYKAYRKSKGLSDKNGLYYFTVSLYGVPNTIVVIACGRSSYLVSDFAANFFGKCGNSSTNER